MSNVIAQRLLGEPLLIDTDGNQKIINRLKLKGLRTALSVLQTVAYLYRVMKLLVSSGKGLAIHNACCGNVKDYATEPSNCYLWNGKLPKKKRFNLKRKSLLDIINEPGGTRGDHINACQIK
ncbi:hypothetical protein INT82_14230 [Mannheimia haemolytica]|nr:hypothetical protein [Mannheimia haemolytica]